MSNVLYDGYVYGNGGFMGKICVGCGCVFTGFPAFCDVCRRRGKDKPLDAAPDVVTEEVTASLEPSPFVTKKVTDRKKSRKGVTEKVTLIAGKPCPTCGRNLPLSAAEKQRRYRERQIKKASLE